MKYILGSRKVYDRMEEMLMSDLVERARDKNISTSEVLQDLLEELADEIERLRTENDVLSKANDEVYRVNCHSAAEIEQLRTEARHVDAEYHGTALLLRKAADEIERLQKLSDLLAAEITRLRGIPDWKIGEGMPK